MPGSSFWVALTKTFQQPAGNLAYALVLSFALAGALQVAFLYWRATQYPQTARLLRGLGFLLVLRLFFFLAQILAWQQVLPAAALPGLDRLVNVSGVLLLGWLWLFPEPAPRADSALGLGLFLLLALAGLSWQALAPEPSPHTIPWDVIWSVAGLIFAWGGFLFLLWRRPDQSLPGLVALGLLGLGHGLHLLLGDGAQGYSPVLRLSELAAYPFVFSLIQRYPLPAPTAPLSPSRTSAHAEASPPPPPPPHQLALQSLLDALHLLDALQVTRPEERIPHLVRAAAQYLVADVCLLISPPRPTGYLDIIRGYDLIREQPIAGGALSAEQLPLVTAALEKGKVLRLPASSTSRDLQTLTQWLGMNSNGPLMAVPLGEDDEGVSLGGLIFFSPYAQHSWSNEEAARGRALARAFAALLRQPAPAETIPRKASEPHKAPEQEAELRAQLENAREELAASEAERRRLEQELEAAQEHLQNLSALLDELQAARERLEQLEHENRELLKQHARKAPTVAPIQGANDAEIEQLRQNLRLALEEIAALKAELALYEQQGAHGLAENGELLYQSLLTLAQDVRQHMATVVGYTDLLLGESVGILGQLQRKFLERIHAAAMKVTDTVDNVMRLTAVDLGMKDIQAEPVRLAEIVDSVLAANSELLRKKGLLLRADLPDTLPALHFDRDALYQILHNLIYNAALASPEEGEVVLQIEVQDYPEGPFLHLVVRDSGPGIAEEDIPRVFSRIYRTGYRTIEGVGDNGVGLPLAKTLTEALGGRIWVESEPGAGSAFHVLLPIPPANTGDDGADANANAAAPSEEQA